MPNVTATPKGLLNGEVVTEFTDTTGTSSVTYTYPVQQAGIMIENSGVSDIYVTVGTFTNQVVSPDKKWRADVVFNSFSIRSDANSQEFIATAYQYDVEGGGGYLGKVTDEINYLNLSQKNLYNDAAATLSYYGSNVNGTLIPNSSYKISDFIPVTPGKQYCISASLNLAFYDVNKSFVSGFAAGWVSPVVVPTGTGIKYLRASFTIGDKNSMVVQGLQPALYIPYQAPKNAYLTNAIKAVSSQEIDNHNYIKNSMRIDTLEAFAQITINLANPAEFAAPDTGVLNTTGNIYTVPGYTASGFIPVDGGVNYYISDRNNFAWYDANKVYVSGALGGWTGTAATNVQTSPNNAEYLRVTFSTGSTTKMVGKSNSNMTYVPYGSGSMGFASDTWKNTFRKMSSPLNGLKWNALGDSITYGSYANGFPYHQYISDRSGVTVRNYGISMSTVAEMPMKPTPSDYNPMCLRYGSMDNDADIITIMGGTNDVLHGADLGVMTDRVTTTFYGALHTLLSGLLDKYPTKSVAYMLPPFGNPGSTTTMEQFISAIREVCKYYAIPVLDTYTGNQLSTVNANRKSAIISDGVHPNEIGHKKLSFVIEQFLLSI